MSPLLNRFDVVIPCYNYGRYLRDCVDSVLSQTNVVVRILIIDDCSSDDTATIGPDLARQDPRIEYRRHETNRGHVATYNEGLLGWAEGDFCLLLSADDMLADGAFARAAEVFAAHPRVGLVFGDAPKTAMPEDCRRYAHGAAAFRTNVYPGSSFLFEMCREAVNSVPTPTAVVRTALQHQIGGYRADLPHTCDFEMWLRCAAYADVAHIDAVQAFYRVHSTQMSGGFVGLSDLREVKLAFDRLFDAHGGAIADSTSLRHIADHSLAIRAYWQGAHLFDAGDIDKAQDYLALALELWPELRDDRLWRNFKVKQFLGPRVWGAARRFVRAAEKCAITRHRLAV
jgi:glycosyltransferase involved in cell wall biosynthesis